MVLEELTMVMEPLRDLEDLPARVVDSVAVEGRFIIHYLPANHTNQPVNYEIRKFSFFFSSSSLKRLFGECKSIFYFPSPASFFSFLTLAPLSLSFLHFRSTFKNFFRPLFLFFSARSKKKLSQNSLKIFSLFLVHFFLLSLTLFGRQFNGPLRQCCWFQIKKKDKKRSEEEREKEREKKKENNRTT